MINLMRTHFTLLVLGCLLCLAPAHAFGPAGHRAVARIAETELSPSARAEVDRLLALEGVQRLDEVATWADELRDMPGYEYASRWHYVNLGKGECRYRAEVHCPEGNCVVSAIETQRRILADRKAAPVARAQALKWLVHLVADIHQPLHTGYAEDRGGNLHQVQLKGKGTNLHAAWDSGIIALRDESWPKLAKRLARNAAAGSNEVRAGIAEQWAEESCALLDSVVYPRKRKLSRNYLDQAQTVIDARIRLAAARLAAMLNATLSP